MRCQRSSENVLDLSVGDAVSSVVERRSYLCFPARSSPLNSKCVMNKREGKKYDGKETK